MEANIEQLRCGECGEKKHELYVKQNGDIITECIQCESKSLITTSNKVEIKNHSGSGTLCKF